MFSVVWWLLPTTAFKTSGNQHQADAHWLKHLRERHFLFLLQQTSASVATPCYHDDHILLEKGRSVTKKKSQKYPENQVQVL